MKKLVPFAVFLVVAASLAAGSYFFVKKFLADRQSAMRTPRVEPEHHETTEATERGELDPSGNPVRRTTNGTAAPMTEVDKNQAAIQRQLQTLEEINKTNEMNRRLMEQQRQMQKQR